MWLLINDITCNDYRLHFLLYLKIFLFVCQLNNSILGPVKFVLSKQNKLQKGLHPKIMSKMFNLQVISLKSKNNVKILKFSAIIFLTKNIATINFEAMQDDSSSSIALPNKIMLQLKVSAVTFHIQKCLYQKVWLRGRM